MLFSFRNLSIYLCIIVGFITGYNTHRYFTLSDENKKLAQTVKQNNITATKEHAVNGVQTNARSDYYAGVDNDTNRISSLINMLNDSMLLDTKSNTTTPGNVSSGSVRTPPTSDARLHRQLSEALKQYGSEAARANKITRRLNECIVILNSRADTN